ncbi:MAG TPA: ATP synthase subunit I [Candidatus Acidoferrales bacterium]|nr:ATP synthase subunit I [Candidatus Acidoferrales bacterium]
MNDNDKDNDKDEEHLNQPADAPPAESLLERTNHERIIPRVLRNMLVVSVLLLGPAFWFYGWAGSIGFAFGAAVSCVNFRSLTRGVEGLADRIVNRNSREKGGRIILRFLVRYGLVGAVAYAIFRSSSLAFRGFLWGLCVPVVALMAEAVWEGYMALRRAS